MSSVSMLKACDSWLGKGPACDHLLRVAATALCRDAFRLCRLWFLQACLCRYKEYHIKRKQCASRVYAVVLMQGKHRRT